MPVAPASSARPAPSALAGFPATSALSALATAPARWRRTLWLPPVVLAAVSLWQGARLRRAVAKARDMGQRMASHAPSPQAAAIAASAPARVLVLGDSLAVGVGAGDPQHTTAGLIEAEFPHSQVLRLARSGARVRDLLAALDEPALPKRFDLIVLHVGGNDILRGTPQGRLGRELHALLCRLRAMAPKVVWLSTANIGLAPLFLPPFSWWLTQRNRRAGQLFAKTARAVGVDYVDFFAERERDVFSRDHRRYFAADGLHPSAASYRHCYEVAKRQSRFDEVLCPGA